MTATPDVCQTRVGDVPENPDVASWVYPRPRINLAIHTMLLHCGTKGSDAGGGAYRITRRRYSLASLCTPERRLGSGDHGWQAGLPSPGC